MDKAFYTFMGFSFLALAVVACLFINQEFKRAELCEEKGGHYVSKLQSCLKKDHFIALGEMDEQ